jgi:hypothetical protein
VIEMGDFMQGCKTDQAGPIEIEELPGALMPRF